MKTLIVAATLPEISPLMASMALNEGVNNYREHVVYVLITGVGMVATAYALGYHLGNFKYDLAINLGIAGSFDRSIALGEVVHVTRDHFAELGAEDGDGFLTIDELGFGASAVSHQLSAVSSQLSAGSREPDIRTVTGITVNRVHGNVHSIEATVSRLAPHTESMEGAAFFYACNSAAVPAMQLRSISNYVERRNREAWNIGLAIKNLNIFAEKFITDLLKAGS
ncbi:futalosine hydrolase [Hufsiella ginkgonis]|uniref:Futalosine hydrolase n=1 Tax=Hufsiella ginkgonis TaxID=2695274 RepID=A0A7K1XVB7_9SPHI|nr:futalosine hydrolase [Hufsiella ginkgonis]MXV14955.1 futalosine hydrolase [Hufsiella ginkgonis]